MKCETCKFARHFPDPGPEPVDDYVEPTTFWGKFFDCRSDLDDVEFEIKHNRWWTRKNETMCERFPEVVRKNKSDTCGEFQQMVKQPQETD